MLIPAHKTPQTSSGSAGDNYPRGLSLSGIEGRLVFASRIELGPFGPLPSGNRDRGQHYDQRIQRPEIVGLGMGEIVGQREEEQHDRESHAQRTVPLPHAS